MAAAPAPALRVNPRCPSCPKDAGLGRVEGFLHGLGVGRNGAEVVLPCALFEPRQWTPVSVKRPSYGKKLVKPLR